MEAGRIKIAVEFLKDGQSFKIGDLRLGMIDKTNVYVTGWSQYSDIDKLTKHLALKELVEIKTLFIRMVDASQDLRDFIQGKCIKYNLAFDYGMGAIGICSEKDEVIEWETDISE